MKTTAERLRLVLGAACLTLGSAASGAEAGPSYYVKAVDRSLIGDRLFDPDGSVRNLGSGSLQDHQLNVYGALQLDERWSLSGSLVPVGWARWGRDDASDDFAYFGGGQLGARYAPVIGELRLSVGISAGARPGSGPLLGEQTLAPRGNEPGLRVVAEPVVGTAHGGLDLGLQWSLPFGWLSASVGGQAFSAAELQPALTGFLQLGFVLGPVNLDGHLNGWYAFGELTDAPVNIFGAGQTRYVGFGVGAEWWVVPEVAVVAGFEGALFAANNFAAPSLTLGVAFRGQ